MKLHITYGLLLTLLFPLVLRGQAVGEIMWSDNFDDDDPKAQFDVGWFYYGASDGLVGNVVEQRDGSLYLEQGSFQIIGVTLAGTNGVPFLETDENGNYTEQTKEALLMNDFSSPNQQVAFQVNFRDLTSSWFIAPTRMLQDSDHIDANPQMSPAYLVFISPLEGVVNLAKTPAVENAMLDPGGYQWLANPVSFAFELDLFYWIKWYLYQGVYKVKVWPGEYADEPAEWLIETEDPDPRVTGEFTYFALLNPDPNGKDVMLIDNVTFWKVTEAGADVQQSQELAGSFMLEQNYPNPFNSTTEITYRLDQAAKVSLGVYNCAGQMVRQLVDER